MGRKVAILDQAAHRRKRCVLSEHEVFLLMKAYTQGKTVVNEDDAMIVVRWAEAQRLGAVLLGMVLQGDLCVEVEAGDVKVSLRP